ncbi:MAG: DNA recombination protein RmuC [Elusimicrobia bacterium]|nr:DNA recombination protein RmuC [Elusimicrobiota bacterium]
MQITLIIILAVVAASFAAWTYFLKKEANTKNKDVLELSSKLEDRNKDILELSSRSAVLENENKNLLALNEQTEADLKACRAANDALKEEISAFKAKEAELNAVKNNLEENISRQQAAFDKLQASAKDNFRHLADEVFKVKMTELKSESKEIVAPLNDNLEKLQEKLARMQNLNESLQKEAGNLANALQFKNKTQGNFGEMILEDVLIASGLKKGVHYETQTAMHSEDGAAVRSDRQPDCLINMPDERYVVIDSKMSLTAYTNYVNEQNPEKKAEYLNAHISSIEHHIDELSKKKYQDLKEIKGRTPDFVLMFIPVEYAYMAALEAKPGLGVFAGGKKIALVTASSLIPILKTVESLWRISVSQKNIDEIVKIGGQLHDRIANFYENMQKIKKGLTDADKAFGGAMLNLDGNLGLLTSARKLKEIGVKTAKKLPQNAALTNTEENAAQPKLTKEGNEEESLFPPH